MINIIAKTSISIKNQGFNTHMLGFFKESLLLSQYNPIRRFISKTLDVDSKIIFITHHILKLADMAFIVYNLRLLVYIMFLIEATLRGTLFASIHIF